MLMTNGAHTASSLPSVQEIKDRAWITYKARIYAEKRMNLLRVFTNLGITNISFFLIIYSLLFSLDIIIYTKYDNLIMIGFPIGIVILSLISFFSNFERKAHDYRSSYLDLQHFHDDIKNSQNFVDNYYGILRRYPNHSDFDHFRFLFIRVVWGGKTIKIDGVIQNYNKFYIVLKEITYNFLILMAGLIVFLSPPILLYFRWRLG